MMRWIALLLSLAACSPRSVQHGAWTTLAGSNDAQPPDYHDTVTPEGQAARGLYFSYPWLRRFGAQGVLRALSGTGMNAAVLDVKDARGRVSHRTRVRTFRPQIAEQPLDLANMVKKLKQRGIYTIGRVACFNDPSLSAREPARAIMDARKPEHVWRSRSTAGSWLDPYNRENHAVLLALTREVETMGFDEIQLDYIRFPVDHATEYALYPAQVETPRYAVIRELLRDIDAAVHIPLGVDVFGLAAKNEGDPAGLGQSLNDWVEHIEVFSPMLYVNGMKTWGHGSKRRAGMLIERISAHLRERIGKRPVIRPFIQAFKTGADHWDPAFIREQIEGANNAQADGFLFWHPGSDYAMVRRGVNGLPPDFLPFSLADRPQARD